MSKAKTPEEKAAAKAAKESAKLAGAPVKAGKGDTVANVVRDDVVIRTYTKEKHGDEFVTLANEFASKVQGRKVVTE